MGFIELFVKKPAIAIAVCIIVVLAGIASYRAMPLRQLPVFPPQDITISTTYSGASPSVMQGFVTIPIEEAIANIEGIDYISGKNMQGASTITLKLKSGVDIYKVLTDVNTEVSSVMWRLPKGINNPVISKSVTSSPSIYLAVTSSSMTLEQLTAYVDHLIVPQLRAVKGVKDMRVRGGREYAMRLWLDPNKMAAHGVTALDIRDALNAQHLQAAVGRLKSQMQTFNLSINSSLSTPEQFNNLIISHHDNQLVRLKDIGHAAYGSQEDNSSVFIKGKPGVILYIKNRIDANDIETVNQIKALLPSLEKKLPSGTHLSIVWNPTKFSEESIKTVRKTIWEAIILIILVTCLFLGEFKAMLIPIVTIPLSLLGACIVLYLIGFSINTMTLLAAVLAIGLVVDDAIVVLENSHRHILNKVPPTQAAIEGTKEIFLIVIAMTLVVAIVFVPIALTSGITGILFREFALTLSFTVLLSGIFSLIVSPMMCAHMLKAEHSKMAHWVNVTFDKIAEFFQGLLEIVMKGRYIVIAVMIALFCICYFFFQVIPSELLPQENQGVILGIGEGPSTANSDYITKYAKQVSKIYQTIPEAATYGIITGDSAPYNNIVSFLVLKSISDSEDQLIKSLQPKFDTITGMHLYPMNRPLLADVIGLTSPVSFVIQSTGSYEQLNSVVQNFLKTIKQNTKLLNVSTDLHMSKPQINLQINRDKAISMGITPADIADTLNIFMGKPTLAWFDLDGYSYPVIPQAIRQDRAQPSNLESIYTRDSGKNLVPLSTIMTYNESIEPLSLNDFQMLHSATINASLAPGYTLGQALQYLTSTADKELPKNMKYDFFGESRLYEQSHNEIYFIYLSSLICIYLLLVIKFNSFVDPVIILVSVPLSMVGALLMIYLNGFTLNIYTQIGLVMLMGLISKHGIMIVDFANHLQSNDKSIRAAVIEATKIRLRPILMTTLAMVLGAIPLTMASGAGHESLQQIGWTIVGGLIFGSILTLFVVPCVYTFLAKRVSE